MKKERNGGGGSATTHGTWRGGGRGVRSAVGPDRGGTVLGGSNRGAHTWGGGTGEGPDLERERRSVG
jgi:hypothetical protein